MPHEIKMSFDFRMVLELVFLITVQAAGYPLISVSCRSLLTDVNSKVYQEFLMEVSLHFGFVFELRSVMSGKEDECDIATSKDH